MSNPFKPEDVLEGTRLIRAYLPELLGDQAQAVDQDIAALLAQMQQGESADEPLLELLKQHEATSAWMGEYLSSRPVTKGFEQLPGRSGAIAARKFVCPYNDYVWYQRSAGQTVPRCPTHGALIPVDGA